MDLFTLERMILSGVNICRLNGSHGDHAMMQKIINNVRALNKKLNTHIAILFDLQGPKIRIGDIKGGSFDLNNGSELILTPNQVDGNAEQVYIKYPQFHKDVKVGDFVLIDDGKLELRIEEILSLSPEPKNPSLTIYMKQEEQTDREKAQSIMYMLEHTKMEEIVKSIDICFDPDDLNTLIGEDDTTMEQFQSFEQMVDECIEKSVEPQTNEKSKWILRMEMDSEIMLEKNITMDDVNFTLKNSYGDEVACVYSDYNADKLVFRIRMNTVVNKIKDKGVASIGQNKSNVNPLDQSDQIYMLKNFQDQILHNIVIRGVKNINKVILRKIKDNLVETSGVYKKQDIWVLDTIGTNILDVLALDYIDAKRTFSNDIVEIYNIFGIEAARQTIYNELAEVIEFDGTYINYHHMAMLCDRMTFTNKMISIFRHGINNDNIGPIAKASFEETPEQFLKAARHAELDIMRGVSANIMCGQEGLYGTNAFQVVLDLDEMRKLEDTIQYEQEDTNKMIDDVFGGMEDEDDKCSKNKLVIENNVVNIKASDLGHDDDYNPGF
jgi:DNA-directed RNA polymerase II subunit RPB1